MCYCQHSKRDGTNSRRAINRTDDCDEWRKKIRYGKGKVVAAYAMEALGGVEVYLNLTSALDGGERSASRPGQFTLGERTHGSH
jgi:hypothetical protein